MSYPSLSEYQTAVQHPRLVFSDPALARSSPELSGSGVPRPRSGGFAVTFRLEENSNVWAARCFHKEIKDLENRYESISRFLAVKEPKSFLPFHYLKHGITISSSRYPIVKMQWGNGQTLGAYLEQHHANRVRVNTLSKRFQEIIAELQAHGMAHGDLQHGNILASEAGVTLIDYDGLYVPGMKQNTANEIGHVNFQSPFRDANAFGSDLDRFSSLVIFLCIESLQEAPWLWKKYATGENLLFRRSDFVDPAGSALIAELKSNSALKSSVERFAALCHTPLNSLPTLDEFINPGFSISTSTKTVVAKTINIRMRQYDALLGSDYGGLRKRLGDIVEVVGYVTDVSVAVSKSNRPYAFVNFSDWKLGSFRLVVWSAALAKFEKAGSNIKVLQGHWIAVTGMIEEFRGGGQPSVQIVIYEPSEIQRLSGKDEAQAILGETSLGSMVIDPPGQEPAGSANQAIRSKIDALRPTTVIHNGPTSSATPLTPKAIRLTPKGQPTVQPPLRAKTISKFNLGTSFSPKGLNAPNRIAANDEVRRALNLSSTTAEITPSPPIPVTSVQSQPSAPTSMPSSSRATPKYPSAVRFLPASKAALLLLVILVICSIMLITRI